MGNVLVVSKERGEGKTAVAAGLAQRAREAGRSAAAIKPFGAAEETGDPCDAASFSRLLGNSGSGSTSPIPPRGLGDAALDSASEACTNFSADSVFVECSSEVDEKGAVRLADRLDARVIVVARHRHGMSAEEVAERTAPFSDRLAGVFLNARGTYLGTEAAALAAQIEAAGTPVLGTIPEDRRLLAITVRTVAEHLDGRFLLDEDGQSDRLVEHFLVGGWMMDEGEIYFSTRSDKAVLARGDRPDLQMSALSTPTLALFLTKGIEPIEYVLHEAQEEGACIVVVEQDTLTAMEELGTVVDRARFDHPDKLTRMAELLGAHSDPDALAALLG